MGFLDALLGRTKPVPPNLDELFALPGAALTLEAGTDFKPTGSGSVCFRAAEGKAFSDIEKDVQDLLNMGKDSTPVQVTHGLLPLHVAGLPACCRTTLRAW